MDEGVKRCSICEVSKLKRDFYFRNKNQKYRSNCIQCESIRQKQWRDKNHERIKIYKKQYYEDNREQTRNQHKKYYDDNRDGSSNKKSNMRKIELTPMKNIV